MQHRVWVADVLHDSCAGRFAIMSIASFSVSRQAFELGVPSASQTVLSDALTSGGQAASATPVQDSSGLQTSLEPGLQTVPAPVMSSAGHGSPAILMFKSRRLHPRRF